MTIYAQRLADRGFAAFTFDFRYWGESGGTPRQYESPAAKVQDIRNAVAFLQTLPAIDGDRIGGLGICASAGYMAQAVMEDSSFKSFATVAAWLHDMDSLNALFGEETVQHRMEIGQAARDQYDRTGEVAYVPAYSQDDNSAAMFGDVSYYGSTDRGVIPEWTNRFAVMSWHEWQGFDAMAIALQITTPTLIVHSDGSALPDNAREFYASLNRDAIINVVNQVAIMADLRNWGACRDAFSDRVATDYTSLTGGEPATVNAEDLVNGWETFFSQTFKVTQHLIGSHVVTITGDTATCLSNFQAHHVYLDTLSTGQKP